MKSEILTDSLVSGNFTFRYTGIPGLVVIEPRVFGDGRGFFLETYSEPAFAAYADKAGMPAPVFVQDNHSFSVKGVLRGLHYQYPGWQGKLVRVTRGMAYDVAVDMRDGPTRGNWFGLVLSGDAKNQMYIPEGFAHGFLALTDCEFMYKCTRLYAPGEEGTIAYDDPELGIDWKEVAAEHGIEDFSLSGKDKDNARSYADAVKLLG